MIDTADIFSDINNAVLDLQAADLQSYPAPLRRLGRLLSHDDLVSFNETLLKQVDLDDFLQKSEKTGGSFVGSAELLWPDDDQEILGLQLALILLFSKEPDRITGFGHQFYHSSSRKIMASVQNVVSQLIIPFAREYKAYVQAQGQVTSRLIPVVSDRIFIVHGHDVEARELMARFLTDIGLKPIILNEQPNRGRTIIEKIEANIDVSFAVVLLTPDDQGKSQNEDRLEPRARQNVLLELGYFMSHLGRDKVCAFTRGSVEIPSDFAGVVWENMDDQGGWKLRLAKELTAAGHAVDLQKLIK